MLTFASGIASPFAFAFVITSLIINTPNFSVFTPSFFRTTRATARLNRCDRRKHPHHTKSQCNQKPTHWGFPLATKSLLIEILLCHQAFRLMRKRRKSKKNQETSKDLECFAEQPQPGTLPPPSVGGSFCWLW